MSKYYILNEKEIRENHSYNIGRISPFDAGIPLIDISDRTIEEIYYFRWHTYCKHIRSTPDGYVITEFFPDVSWAGKYNAICCPVGHHLYEGRWLHNCEYVGSYIKYWFAPDVNPRSYSCWLADAIYKCCAVWGDFSLPESLFGNLKENYFLWEKEKGCGNGLFYQIDDRDGMEYSAGGSGIRPTLSCYMYGDATAIAEIANRLGRQEDEKLFSEKAEALRNKINSVLWDEEALFYKTLDTESNTLVNVRELIGYIPWYFGIPEEKMNPAWKYLNDTEYFRAPYGPTTAQRCHPDFMKEFDHECLWNGPSWPFATSQTLTAMSNFIGNYRQNILRKSDYCELLHQYASSHYLTENGKRIPFIDENLDPFTGEWLARKILNRNSPPGEKDERGRDYNHSTFCDCVLGSLAGIVPHSGNTVTVNPMLAPDSFDYFCADGIKYHGHFLTVLWDRDGTRYGKGKGFFIYADGNEVARSDAPEKAVFMLTERLQ